MLKPVPLGSQKKHSINCGSFCCPDSAHVPQQMSNEMRQIRWGWDHLVDIILRDNGLKYQLQRWSSGTYRDKITDLGFCSGYSFINSNLQSKVLPGKSHQGVDFAFNFGYFTPLSQRYSLYYVIEILIWINLWWGNKANPKSCKLWASLWGKSSPVLEACLQCGRNNLSQKPEAKLFTSFQQQMACRPPKKGELDSFILKHSF